MPKSIKFKGYVVYADSYSLTNAIWDSYYWVEALNSGRHVYEAVHVALRETDNAASNAALVRGLQYVDLFLPEADG
jgi:hypothetical protein